jgi:hypothetical protein
MDRDASPVRNKKHYDIEDVKASIREFPYVLYINEVRKGRLSNEQETRLTHGIITFWDDAVFPELDGAEIDIHGPIVETPIERAMYDAEDEFWDAYRSAVYIDVKEPAQILLEPCEGELYGPVLRYLQATKKRLIRLSEYAKYFERWLKVFHLHASDTNLIQLIHKCDRMLVVPSAQQLLDILSFKQDPAMDFVQKLLKFHYALDE